MKGEPIVKLKSLWIIGVILSGSILANAIYSAAYAITEEEANKFARQSYEKAMSLSRSSNSLDAASMYFINALSFNPGRIDIISAYVNMIIRSAEKNPSFSTDALDALDGFLSAQIMTVKPDDIQKIIRLRETVSKTQEAIINRNANRNAGMGNTTSSANSNRDAKKYRDRAEKARSLKDYIQEMRNAQEALEGNDESDISENLQSALALEAGIKQIEKLLVMSENRSLEPLQMYYLQLAESSFQQIAALGAFLPDAVNQEIIALRKKIDTHVEKISEARSAIVLEQINREYEEMKYGISLMDTEQKKIDAINAFMQGITERTQQITSPKAGEALRDLMQAVQQQMMACREEQERRYNQWAIDEIKDVTVELNGRGSLDSSSICNIIIAHMAKIDTRYLNFGAQNRFNSVYVECYQKMKNDADKEAADIALASNGKRKLSEF